MSEPPGREHANANNSMFSFIELLENVIGVDLDGDGKKGHGYGLVNGIENVNHSPFSCGPFFPFLEAPGMLNLMPLPRLDDESFCLGLRGVDHWAGY